MSSQPMKLETPPGSGNFETVTVPPDTSPNVVITDPNVTTTTEVGAAALEGVFNVPETVVDASQILAKLDDLTAKVDHLLEHMHQPLSGTVTLECPTKVP